MSSKLPLHLDDLLRQRTVEGDRIEYKAGWNPDATLRTLCAFANDFENLGGGYVVIGQDCDENGQPIFPPVGLRANQLEPVQRDLLAFCNQKTSHFDDAVAAYQKCAAIPGGMQSTCTQGAEEAKKLAATQLSAPK